VDYLLIKIFRKKYFKGDLGFGFISAHYLTPPDPLVKLINSFLD